MARISKTLAAITASVAMAGLPSAQAAPPPDAAGWIRQGGNGSSGSTPANGFALSEILFRTDRFEDARTHLKTPDNYQGWGAFEHTDGTFQLFMSHGGTDGTFWTNPQPAILRDPAGNDVPFLLGDTVHFAVQFQNLRQDQPAYFIVYWNGADTVAGSTHMAVSADGVTWFDDVAIGDADLLDAGSFNEGLLGATQLFLNPRAGFCDPTSNPYACALTIVTTFVDPSGTTRIGLAGSDRYDPLGTEFTAYGSPLLSPGGVWDTGSVDLGKIRQRKAPEGSGWELTYAGATGLDGCGTLSGNTCSIGVASSGNRLAWAKNNPARAATEPALFEDALGLAPGTVSLGPASFVSNGPDGHARGFIALHDGSVRGSTWYASTSPAPTTAPTLEVSKPDNGYYNDGSLEIDLFANDDLGANPGIDLASIEVLIDGVPAEDLGLSWFTEPSIIGSFYELGTRIRGPEAEVVLPDGLHTLEASLLDLDGEPATLSTQFTVDTTPPATVIDTIDAYQPYVPGVTVGAPLGRLLTMTGETTDSISGLERINAVVTNQLGTATVFDSRNPGSGFTITEVDETRWTWTWTPPPHPNLMVPGQMTFSILGRDKARNVELANGANTTSTLKL